MENKIRKALEDAKNYRTNEVDIDIATHKLLDLFNVINSFPSFDEMMKEAKKVENYDEFMDEIQGATASGRFHGFKKGCNWIAQKVLGNNL